MAAPFDRVVREVLDRTSLVAVIQDYVPLKRQGRGPSWKGLCPFHQEKTPSFHVNEDKKVFYCFGCQTGGNAITFLKLAGGLTAREALQRLAERAGITLPRDAPPDPAEDAAARERADLLHAVQAAQEFFRIALMGPGGERARGYLASRGIEEGLADRYGLGYGGTYQELVGFLEKRRVPVRHAEAVGLVTRGAGGWHERFRGRLVCPVFNLDGAPVAFSARLIPPDEDGPKYVNSPDSPVFKKGDLVFGLQQAKAAIRRPREAILVEGNFDVLSMAAAGFENTVAPLGTALTSEQLRMIRRFAERLTVMFDGDEAGRKASRRAVGLLVEAGIEGRVAALPDGEDPDTLARKKGPEAVRDALDRARPMVTHLLESLLRLHGDTPHGARRVIEEAKEVFDLEKDPFRHGRYVEELARVLKVDVREVGRLLRRKGAGADEGTADVACPAAERMLLELLLVHGRLVDRFLAIGSSAWLTHPEAREVLQDLLNASLSGDENPTDAFLESAEGGGPLRAAVARVVHQPEKYPEADADAAFGQVCRRLELAAVTREEAGLREQLSSALDAGATEQAAALQVRQLEVARRILRLKSAIAGKP